MCACSVGLMSVEKEWGGGLEPLCRGLFLSSGGAAVLTGQSRPHAIWTNNIQRYRGSCLCIIYKNTAIISIFTPRKSDDRVCKGQQIACLWISVELKLG